MPQAALVLDLPPHIQLVILHEVASGQQLYGHLPRMCMPDKGTAFMIMSGQACYAQCKAMSTSRESLGLSAQGEVHESVPLLDDSLQGRCLGKEIASVGGSLLRSSALMTIPKVPCPRHPAASKQYNFDVLH